jgi:hypothetical protein
MAITVLSQPDAYVPAYNAHYWVASSTNVAQPNFKYYVIVTDLISNISASWAIDPDINTGYLYFNSATFAETFITQVVPEGLYDFQRNTGAIRKIRVVIEEQYGTPPAGIPSTAVTNEYITWNGVYDHLSYASYSVNTYIYDRSISNVQFITNNRGSSYSYGNLLAPYQNREYTYLGRDSYIYCISKNANEFKEIEIRGYDEDGNLLSTSNITNIYAPGSTYTDKYVFINVGYNGLANIPSTNVTGTYPIPVSTFAYYEIRDISPIVGAGGQTVLIKTIEVKCEPVFDVFTCHYLAPQGSFETFNCSKLADRTNTKQVTTYSQLPYYLNGSNEYTYLRNARIKRSLSTEVQPAIKLNTDWLTEEETSRLGDLWSSPILYMTDGSGYMPMLCKQTSYQEAKRYNKRKLQGTFELEYSHTNAKQRG